MRAPVACDRIVPGGRNGRVDVAALAHEASYDKKAPHSEAF